MTTRAHESHFEELLDHPEQALNSRQRRWLRPLGGRDRAVRWLMYWVNRAAMRTLFRLRVEGLEHVPREGPFLLAPNHASSLDPSAIAAALSYRQARQIRWAAWSKAVLGSRWQRWLSRVAGVMPIDRDISSLAAGAAALQQGAILVWFPEGTRSRSGEIRLFKFGVGMLARHLKAPAIPVSIEGAFEAMPPPRRRLTRLTRIRVTFGEPVSPDSLERDDPQALADELRRRVIALKADPDREFDEAPGSPE